MGDIKYIMACNHVASATAANGVPVCAICLCTTIQREIDTSKTPNAGLEGRMCVCPDCGTERPSSWSLPFFKYRPDRETDSAYDGCYGWD